MTRFVALLITMCFALTTYAETPPSDEESSLSLEETTAEALLEATEHTDARVTLVNVWATWCKPCVEEMPALLELQERYGEAGLRLLLVSADFKDQRQDALDFLASLNVDFPTYVKAQSDQAFIDGLHPDWSGALPASFIYDQDGEMRHFIDGDTTLEELIELVEPLLEEAQDL